MQSGAGVRLHNRQQIALYRAVGKGFRMRRAGLGSGMGYVPPTQYERAQGHCPDF